VQKKRAISFISIFSMQSGDVANLDIGARALFYGGIEQRKEGLDGWATKRSRVGAEKRG
jgi:hypothetical protein